MYFCQMDELVKKQVEAGTMLPLMEEFYTIQGEGFHTGKAAYFIRIGGCDVGCHWCDVKESWNADLHPPTAISQVVENAAHYSNTVVVTGGEPLTWNMNPLTEALKAKDLQIHIETSGAYDLSGEWDWICLSPKKTKPPVAEIYREAHELKVIVYNNHDLKWAEEHAAKVGPNCKLFLQAEWSRRDKMLPIISDYVMANPQWQISLQSHKYIGLP
ncbi:MAG: 7-carboxy-7-deazaguanine synthase QueE [Croceimicrobium sp.]|nr:7-carboxy-7-deazaguanine synthase QueE [Bacteroidota bacterium]